MGNFNSSNHHHHIDLNEKRRSRNFLSLSNNHPENISKILPNLCKNDENNNANIDDNLQKPTKSSSMTASASIETEQPTLSMIRAKLMQELNQKEFLNQSTESRLPIKNDDEINLLLQQTFDVLMQNILLYQQKNPKQMDCSDEFRSSFISPSSTKSDAIRSTSRYIDDEFDWRKTPPQTSEKILCNNLALMLSQRFDDYLANCKRLRIVPSSVYKSCSNNLQNLDAIQSNDSRTKTIQTALLGSSSPQLSDRTFYLKSCPNIDRTLFDSQTNNDVSEKNARDLINRSTNSLNELMDLNSISLNQQSDCDRTTKRLMRSSSFDRRRFSLNNSNNLIATKSNLINENQNSSNLWNNLILNKNQDPQDTIRINLPEILDEKDEISILRLLIKLLSSKVRKLNDEKDYLFEQITALNEINTELSTIIQRRFEK
ncbi:hypothetical protein SSS_06252 [Sarcoptes scabiei]|uniref:Uncharacterized protein n=1 Tax=Sarcoptes scabiei TaxID=52283 RepID=A0A834RC82_SARSC|nr:hypothetical protein SSS_06252 [Sarcoptes scabiei]